MLLEIPKPESIAGWKGVAIEECGEPLIRLNDLDPKIEIEAEYYRMGIKGASPTQYLCQGAVERLLHAASLLPRDHRLLVFDAYRSLTVQATLFDDQVESLKLLHPGLNDAQLREVAQRYVSIPSDNPEKPSPHATGGAVDLSIVGPGGVLLDMGTKFDHFGEEAQTAYYKNMLPYSHIHDNRRLLYTVMIRAGFTNYFEEWWHFDFGNQFWGKVTGQTAIYGLVDFDTLNGKAADDPTIPHDVDTVIYRVRSEGNPEIIGPKFGLAGRPEDLYSTLQQLLILTHPHFGIKQQLVEIIIRKNRVHRFAF